ncbi:MAG TPA: multicopper oxidase family protein [Longimicrobiaceae bacterium]|nr:multicopper oxidase family protein [Longimicrobiaceae bacterium]
MPRFRLPVPVLAAPLLVALPAHAQADSTRQSLCAPAPAAATAPSRDLYCLELIPVPDLRRASGVVELGTVPSPFGVALTADGRHLYDLAVTLRDLPPPASLGPYTAYVAWAAPPTLEPMLRLGPVGVGRTPLGRVALNKFLVFITAEPSADVQRRSGPLVLRGASPSMRMGDAHFLGGGSSGEHARHGEEGGWTMPPADPRVAPMPMPGIEHAVPAATPYLPGAGVDPATLPLARPRELHELGDGDTLRLEAGLVRRTLKGRSLVMFAFNGQHPGPLIRVAQGTTVIVDFRNRTEWPAAVHWHGVRLDNASDGVPHVTQDPVAPGGRFVYRVHFRDAGTYWYHPHHREDVLQDLGLAGNILVLSPLADYYGPAHREQVLMLDDILLGEAGLVPYGAERATHAVMGRFGNVLLVNGEPSYRLEAKRGEVVRFHLTNVSNVRVFNLSFAGARMKVVATDVGRFEREEWVESVAIAPAERYVVDVRFDTAGSYRLLNRVQALDHGADRFFAAEDTLGAVDVGAEPASPDLSAAFGRLRQSGGVASEIDRYRRYFDDPPRLELVLTLENRGLSFPLERLLLLDAPYFNPVEWAGTMPMMDWLPTSDEVRWVLRDAATGRENEGVEWRFRQGEVVRLRLHNDRAALHAMQHPIHIHGQRFLVLAVNGVPNPNLAWKDTVLVPVGASVDVLLELSNPGRWMLHCHVAEHLEAGMQLVFTVQ